MHDVEISDNGLLEYLMPEKKGNNTDRQLAKQWLPNSEHCVISQNCWCALHFKGSMDKTRNPNGIHTCMKNSLDVIDCAKDPYWGPYLRKKSCPCLIEREIGQGCLFGDMRPIKLLAVMSLARRLGVTHIVEEGRYGGLSAYIYNHQGFKVTSIEWVPLDDVTHSLERLAPAIKLVNGDGRVLTPQVISEAAPSERIAVIFDGTKRQLAYDTSWLKVKDRVAFAAFDDTNVAEMWPYNTTRAKRTGFAFDLYLGEHNETFWNSRHTSGSLFRREKPWLDRLLHHLRTVVSNTSGHATSGGIEGMQRMHFSIVAGGQWNEPGCVTT